ncbi:uncharacterized protein V1516DRAFT_265715 [Lipomyces oligophaga]|uniref:uncharacterized protein n=1 Tax=Lipomyces oligophaga TaxID=45792 RepID=UPI0034CD9B97
MSLESALEEERLEIVKLLEQHKPKDELQLPSRVSRSASPLRSRRESASPSEPKKQADNPYAKRRGELITSSMLAKNFHNLSPAAQELLLSTTSVPELDEEPVSNQTKSARSSSMPRKKHPSLILPSAGPELKPYPSIRSASHASSMLYPVQSSSSRPRSSSFNSSTDGGTLRRYKSADETGSSLPYVSNEIDTDSYLLSPTTSYGQPLSPTSTSNTLSPTHSHKSPSDSFSNAYRRLSDANMLKAGGKLAQLAVSKRSQSSDTRLEEDDDDENAIESSSEDSSSDESDSGSDLEESVARQQPPPGRQPQSLMAAMEDERKAVSSVAQKYVVHSLIEPPPPSRIDGLSAKERRHLVHPKTAFDLVDDANKNSPYTSDGEERIDIKKAMRLPIKVSDIESNREAGRVLRTITRGYADEFKDKENVKHRSYIVATDASSESMYALEWTVGTILRDGNLMYAVYAMEEPEEDKNNPIDESVLEQERIDAAKEVTAFIVKLLKKTLLQVECVVEVMHCKSPKHLLCDVIDYINPTMVILGSRGRSALKGVLLGSFSNYLVTKSSVPVMVARKKLKKTKHRNRPVKFSNNLREGVSTLSLAKVD